MGIDGIDAGETDITGSNSLADLAARIKTEHEAAESCMRESLKHSINAGNLLLEAKAQLKHGQWLRWLRDHVEISTRTAQLYMQLAKAPELKDDSKYATPVAHLPVREVAALIAYPTKQLRHMRLVERRAAVGDMLETPPALLPTPQGRKMRVARNAKKRQWLLAVGPDISRAELKEREKAARNMPAVQKLQQQQDDLKQQADELEAQAKALRKEADAVREEIGDSIRQFVGPAHPYTDTFDFQADEATDVELVALKNEQLVIERLLAARNGSDSGLLGIERGYWGDMTVMCQHRPDDNFVCHRAPGEEPGKSGWTKMGSPEWLNELFPGWNETATSTVAPATHCEAPLPVAETAE